MSDRGDIAWLYRRVGFGPAVGQLDVLAPAGVSAALDALVDPDSHGEAAAPDPWVGIDLSQFDMQNGNRREAGIQIVSAWLQAMATTPRPAEEWMRWFWHGHFVSTLQVVKYPQLMIGQLQTLGREGLGDFRSLLRAMTVDPAMLVYLDGATSSKKAVNENYGREVLELFSLGIGNYTEADVRAGSEALTGYHLDKTGPVGAPTTAFEPRRHDDTLKTYLGRDGVHDVDSVIDAIVAHQACAPFITAKLARAILGPDVDRGLLTRLAADFASSGLQLRPLLRAILVAGLHGESRELVVGPVPWLVSMVRATGVPLGSVTDVVGTRGLAAAGQVPLDAPNVAGWPGGRSWLSASATIARVDLAAALAAATAPDAPLRARARAGDPGGLADALGHPEGFTAATLGALAGLHAQDPNGDAVLTVAMAAPDLVLG